MLVKTMSNNTVITTYKITFFIFYLLVLSLASSIASGACLSYLFASPGQTYVFTLLVRRINRPCARRFCAHIDQYGFARVDGEIFAILDRRQPVFAERIRRRVQ